MWKITTIITLIFCCLSIGTVYVTAYLIGSTHNTDYVVVYFMLLGINIICIFILFILLFIRLVKYSNRLNTFALIISMLFVSVLLYGELWEYTQNDEISQVFDDALLYSEGNFQVHGQSMEPNLNVMQIVYGNEINRELRNGDIVLLDSGVDTTRQGRDVTYIKRIIASPGQNIRINSGKIYIDGNKIIEPYDTKGYINSGVFREVGTTEGYSLSDDEYFVIGDNREHSNDSRDFGPVKRQDIKLVFEYDEKLEAEIQKVNW